MTNTIPRDCARICQGNAGTAWQLGCHLPECRGKECRALLQGCMWLRALQHRGGRIRIPVLDFQLLKSSY